MSILLTKLLPDMDFQIQMAIVLLLLPLFSFAILFFLGKYLPRKGDITASVLMGIATILSVYLFADVYTGQDHYFQAEWFKIIKPEGYITFTFSILLNKVSAMMLVVVTFIALMVHIYSLEYMEGKRNYQRYFPYLALFTFSMLGIVLSDNLLIMFVFWELVGFSSFLLIGFWFEKDSASQAAKKAFLFNRVGDFGFICGLLILWSKFDTLELTLLQEQLTVTSLNDPMLILAGLGLFCGTLGKSAQFPLMAWLPDAMEGPTPVSALIHAATMVAAGVYLLFKIFFLLALPVLDFIAIIGATTALMGAIAAITQNDIKKVLAFSTVSQLGYMVMAMGVGAYDAALFHLLTHAFFKACLFLSAGAVIHTMHHIQKDLFAQGKFFDFSTLDMRMMGGLRQKMPVTFITYLISTLSLIGVPLFSGFLSKDAILIKTMDWAAYQDNSWKYLIPAAGLATVFLTAFYMGRQLIMVFFGESRLVKQFPTANKAFDHASDPGIFIKLPLLILATLSLFPLFSFNPFDVSGSWFMQNTSAPGNHSELLFHYLIPFATIILGVLGLFLAWKKYNPKIQNLPTKKEGFWYALSANNFYQDYATKHYIEKPVLWIAGKMHITDQKVIDGILHSFVIAQLIIGHIAAFIDKYILDGIVHLLSYISGKVANITRSWQTGGIQSYVFYMIAAILLFLIVIIQN
jgi:NADH-quinone oxidoreductase subunit L